MVRVIMFSTISVYFSDLTWLYLVSRSQQLIYFISLNLDYLVFDQCIQKEYKAISLQSVCCL